MQKKFTIIFADRFSNDIEYANDWYNSKQKGLGKKFKTELKQKLNSINKNPFFQNRYDEIRCLPLKKFPFMIHYSVDEKQKVIYILACIHCAKNPDKYWLKEAEE